MTSTLNSTQRWSTSTSTSSTNNNAGFVAGWRPQTRNVVLHLCCVGFLAIYSIVTTSYSVNQKYIKLIKQQYHHHDDVSSAVSSADNDGIIALRTQESSGIATSSTKMEPRTTTTTTTATLPLDEVVSGGGQSRIGPISPGSTPTASSTTTAASNRSLSAMVFQLRKRGQGFGSLTVNAFIYGMYFEKVYNRTFYIDEHELKTYQWNKTVLLYEGFFEHNFPIYRPGHTDFEAMNNNNTVMTCDMVDWRDFTPSYMNGCNVLFASLNGPTMESLRYTVTYLAKQQVGVDHVLYDPLAEYMCEKLPRLSQQAQQEVDAMIAIQSANMSDGPLPSKFDVAFHIRRGDKSREVPLWDAEKYLETYEKANPAGAAKAKHCFLATDDYAVVNEFKEAMKMNQTNITCQVWTLTDENYSTTRDRGDFILYLAQQQIMVQADYFVGMFTSNIGTIVSLFRACPSWANHSSSEHYYHSYGVDRDTIIVPF